MTRRSCTTVGAVILLISTGDVAATQSMPSARRFIAVEWKKTVVVEGALDSELLNPGLMVARDSTIYVYDYGDHAVKAFAVDGSLKWRFGRDGRGPGEFGNPTDLQLDRSGMLWLADPATSRVTVIAGNGRLVRTVQARASVERILPLSAGRFLTYAFTGEKPSLERWDSLGRAVGSVRHPPWLDTVPSLVSELRIAAAPDGRQFMFASFYSGRLMRMGADDSVLRDIGSVEIHAFPQPLTYSPSKNMVVRRLPPEARPTIRSMTADTEFAYALILGRHEERGRIIDLYRLTNGSYAGSWLLPERVVAISITTRGVAAMVNDDLPSLYYFERRSKR